jgi:AraC family transcriptional activator of pobA
VKTEIPLYDIKTFEEYKNQGILASRFGHYAKNHKHLHTAHKHSFYHLVFFTSGSGNHFIDFKKYPVEPGMIYFMIPGQVHSWDFTEAPDGYVVNFSAEYFHSFLYNATYLEHLNIFSGNIEQQVFVVPEPLQAQLLQTFEEILSEGVVKQTYDNDLVRTLLLQVFLKVERLTNSESTKAADSYNYTLYRNFQHLIAKRFKDLKLPKEYASLLYITPNHLNALCKDIIGLSAGELIRAQVILEAKRLLVNHNLNIADISEALQFKDHSYFIRFFKKYEGVTPDKFRKHNLNENGN